ncbi:methyl-accepting chemotaxis protein, partial [Salinicola endophyticus]
TLIDASADRTQTGAQRVRDAGAAMDEIVASIARVNGVLGEITAATGEQSQGIGQVNLAVAELDSVTQQNASMVQQTATAAAALQQESQRLAETVGVFTLDDTGAHKRPALGR